MTVGERISERSQQIGLSQSELARRIGIGQSAINHLVRGKSRSSAHLHRIARELGTTPAYLTGETDDPDEDAPVEAPLSYNERELLDCFAALNHVQQSALLTIAKSMAGRTPPGRVHAPKPGFGVEPAR